LDGVHVCGYGAEGQNEHGHVHRVRQTNRDKRLSGDTRFRLHGYGHRGRSAFGGSGGTGDCGLSGNKHATNDHPSDERHHVDHHYAGGDSDQHGDGVVLDSDDPCRHQRGP